MVQLGIDDYPPLSLFAHTNDSRRQTVSRSTKTAMVCLHHGMEQALDALHPSDEAARMHVAAYAIAPYGRLVGGALVERLQPHPCHALGVRRLIR
jgi:hypothetical protein